VVHAAALLQALTTTMTHREDGTVRACAPLRSQKNVRAYFSSVWRAFRDNV
jgi:hypothetical protein